MPKLLGAPIDHGGSERPFSSPQVLPPAENLQRRVITPQCCPVRSSANGMTTIRESELSSTASLESRNDELELIIAASRLGYCLLGDETRGLRANSQFK